MSSSSLQLLSKIKVGGQELKNRVFLAPMTRGRCTPTEDPHDIQCTIPNDLMKEYYVQRASAGLLITEATGISAESLGWRNAPAIMTEQHATAWKKVVDGVHDKGGHIYLQLWHMGRQSHSSYHPTTNRIVSASNIPLVGIKSRTNENKECEPEIPHALTVEEIKTTVGDYVHAAKLCKIAGFDGVEIHGANGYLVDQFLQSCSNDRTDEYGGSIENRARFLMEIVDALVAAGDYPSNRIGVRLSPNGNYACMGSADNVETFIKVAEMLNTKDLAYVHLVEGLGFGFHEKCRPVNAMDIRKVFDGPIICNVGLNRDMAEGMIRSGACDAVAFGRLYISNPDLVERFANDWPVADPAPYETWWYPTGAKGYTDWPTHAKEEETTPAEGVVEGQ